MTNMRIVGEKEPKKQIDSALVELEIKARQKRKRVEFNIYVIVGLAIILFFIPYFYPQYFDIFAIDVLIIVFGSFYVTLSAIPNLLEPLQREYRVFRRIAHAADVLEKSDTKTAYEEAFRDVEGAYEVLRNIGLDEDIAWYRATNDIFKKFLKNLELIVLPAIKKSVIKKEHLEQMALAIYSLDPLSLAEMNKTLEIESDYKESAIKISEPEGIGQTVLRLFRTYAALKHVTVVSSFVIACGVFYYVAVTYLGIQKEYVFGADVALFIGLFGTYFRGRQKSSIQAL